MKLVLKFSKDQVQRSKTISIKRSVTEALRSAEQPAEEKFHAEDESESPRKRQKKEKREKEKKNKKKKKIESSSEENPIQKQCNAFSSSAIQVIHTIKLDDANQIFWSPVTEEVAPGYFSVITKPMDLSTMESKAESGAYKSWSDVQTDFDLMFHNATIFNSNGTFVHKEAKRLHKIANRVIAKSAISAPIETISNADHQLTEKRLIIPAAERKRLLLGVVKELRVLDSYHIFAEPVSKDIPGYYDTIKNPMDFTTLERRINNSKVASVESLEHHINLIFNNAMQFNPSDTVFHKEAMRLLDASVPMFKKLSVSVQEVEKERAPKNLELASEDIPEEQTRKTKPERRKEKKSKTQHQHQQIIAAAPTTIVSRESIQQPMSEPIEEKLDTITIAHPRVDFPVHKFSFEELEQIMFAVFEQLKIVDSYEVFYHPVPKDEVPEYYEIIKKPMDFSLMKKKFDNHEFKTWSDFELDVELIFANCKQFNVSHSVYWKEAARIQRIFRSKLKKVVVTMAEEGRSVDEIKTGLAEIKKDNEKKKKEKQISMEVPESTCATTLGDAGSIPGTITTCDSKKDKKKPKEHPLQHYLSNILETLIREDKHKMFLHPVDTSELSDYLSVVKTPIDFTTMRKKMNNDRYLTINSLKKDFELLCNNALAYNKAHTIWYKEAQRMLQFGQSKIEELESKLASRKAELEAQAASQAEIVAKEKEREKEERQLRTTPKKREKEGKVKQPRDRTKEKPKEKAKEPINFPSSTTTTTIGEDAPLSIEELNRKLVKSGVFQRRQKEQKIKEKSNTMTRKEISSRAIPTKKQYGEKPALPFTLASLTYVSPASGIPMVTKGLREKVLNMTTSEYESVCNSSLADLFAKTTGQTLPLFMEKLHKRNVAANQAPIVTPYPFLSMLGDTSPAPRESEIAREMRELLEDSIPETSITSIDSRNTYPSSSFSMEEGKEEDCNPGIHDTASSSGHVVELMEFPRQKQTLGIGCQNCRTTVTPNWRCGATPDNRLCNACGLYFSKYKHHRPVRLSSANNLVDIQRIANSQ